MKFTCSREALLGALQVAGSVVATRGMKPVHESVLVQSREGDLEIMATDLEVSIRYVLESGDALEISEPGALVVPAARLTSILREVKDDRLEFAFEANVLSVNCSASRFKIHGLPAEEFPQLPTFPEETTIRIPGNVFQRMVSRTEFATAKEKMRFALNGILVLLDDTLLQMVGTDGRRLAHVRSEVENPAGAGIKAIVPTKGMAQIVKVLEADESVDLAVSENQFAARTRKAIVISRLVEGNFPDFEEVIPKNCERRARLGRADLISAIRQAALLTSRESPCIRCSFTGDELSVSSRAAEVGEARVPVSVEYVGEPAEIVFNPTYLLDGLGAMEGDAVSFEFRNPASPAKIVDSEDFTYVVMPISVN